ncbi:hypothetical protein S83_070300, partial [Arachis hypogaea]
EELVRIGVKSANRVDLHSLLPENDVDDKVWHLFTLVLTRKNTYKVSQDIIRFFFAVLRYQIIHIVAMTMTGAEILATSPSYWCLPPSVS